jgi:uncharacterized protein YjiS (DUF1127 family)
MALSLPGERSPAAATPIHPFASFARWIAKAFAARNRRKALQDLLELDAERLQDLGISRADVVAAMSAHSAGQVLNAARARSARG